jgi:exosome complex component RRP42
LILDCSREEEDAAETWLTVTTKDNGNLCALQKSGTEPLTMEEIEKAFDLSISKGKEIRSILEKVKA